MRQVSNLNLLVVGLLFLGLDRPIIATEETIETKCPSGIRSVPVSLVSSCNSENYELDPEDLEYLTALGFFESAEYAIGNENNTNLNLFCACLLSENLVRATENPQFYRFERGLQPQKADQNSKVLPKLIISGCLLIAFIVLVLLAVLLYRQRTRKTFTKMTI